MGVSEVRWNTVKVGDEEEYRIKHSDCQPQ